MKRLILCLVVSFPLIAAPAPTDRAVGIASKSKRVKQLYAALGEQIAKIHSYPAVKKDAEALLKGTHAFKIIERKKDEAAILRELKNEMGDAAFKAGDDGSLFPTGALVPFIAAPASSMTGHHIYPGGLVYHTYTVLEMSLALANVYEKSNGVKLDRDLLRLAAFLHDSAKTFTLHWKADGTTNASEGSIAGTGAHHIWAVAEALYRGYPTPLVVAIAGAHDALMEGNEGYGKVVGYLRAAAIIAGKPLEAAGLKKTDKGVVLAGTPPLAPLINHIGDSDWIVTVPAMQGARAELLKSLAGKFPAEELNWEINRKLAENGEVAIYSH